MMRNKLRKFEKNKYHKLMYDSCFSYVEHVIYEYKNQNDILPCEGDKENLKELCDICPYYIYHKSSKRRIIK